MCTVKERYETASFLFCESVLISSQSRPAGVYGLISRPRTGVHYRDGPESARRSAAIHLFWIMALDCAGRDVVATFHLHSITTVTSNLGWST